jgi:hypothetical protein
VTPGVNHLDHRRDDRDTSCLPPGVRSSLPKRSGIVTAGQSADLRGRCCTRTARTLPPSMKRSSAAGRAQQIPKSDAPIRRDCSSAASSGRALRRPGNPRAGRQPGYRKATASLVSRWRGDGCFTPAMRTPSRSRPSGSARYCFSTRRATPQARIDRRGSAIRVSGWRRAIAGIASCPPLLCHGSSHHGRGARSRSSSWHCYSAARAPADVKELRGACHHAASGVIEMSPKRSPAKRVKAGRKVDHLRRLKSVPPAG